MRSLDLFALSACLCFLTGCDMIYGVNRSAEVNLLPHPATISSIVKNTPGVDNVQFHFSRGGYPITFQARDKNYSFIYTGGTNIWCSLMLTEDHNHHVKFSQSLTMMNSVPSQFKIDATRQVMKLVETDMEINFGPAFFHTPVVEWCHGVECK